MNIRVYIPNSEWSKPEVFYSEFPRMYTRDYAWMFQYGCQVRNIESELQLAVL